jgi:hypothetical protein
MPDGREELRGGRAPRPDRGEPETLPGADLELDIGCRAVLEEEGSDTRMASEIYGARLHDFLIVRMPAFPGVKERLTEGRPLVVRYVCAGFAYGFISEVQSFDLRPYPLIFLEWPRTIRRVRVRGAPRLDASLPAVARGQNVTLHGRVDDLSPSGCLLEAPPEEDIPAEAIEPGGRMRVEMALPGRERPAAVTSWIVNSAKELRSIRLGLRFTPTDEEADAMQAVIDHLEELARVTSDVTPEEIRREAPQENEESAEATQNSGEGGEEG